MLSTAESLVFTLPNDLDKEVIQQVLNSLFDSQVFFEKEYALNITVRDPLLIKIFFKNGDAYFIKTAPKQVSDDVKIFKEFINRKIVKYDALPSGFQKVVREHDALEKCNNMYPGLAPVPILLKELDHYVALMTKNLMHTGVNIYELFEVDSQLQKFLIGHERIIDVKNISPEYHVPTFNQALDLLPENLPQHLQRIRFLRNWDKMLKTFPLVPQHGDFAINNIARTSTGFVIFDWEDYSFVKLPGFDLCILLASGCNFNLSKLLSLIEDDIYKMNRDSFLLPIIQALGIKTSQLIDLIMVNLIIFYQLKVQLGYGREIIVNTENLLEQLFLFVLNANNNLFIKPS